MTMRIAVLTWTDRRAGGIEAYLENVLPELAADGHHVSLWHEVSEPEGREPLALPASIERHRVTTPAAAESDLRRWGPEVILGNGLSDPGLEGVLQSVAPAVFVAHNYHGTCISGTKCWARPVRRPCTRRFGAGCLLHYFPHRCGGLSPVTMLRLYNASVRRLQNVRAARVVVTLSTHMRREYVAHGIDAARVAVAPYGPPAGREARERPRDGLGPLSLVSVGRLEPIKGLDLLLDALPAVAAGLQRRVVLRVIGEGAGRLTLQARARAVEAGVRDVGVVFDGWLSPAARDAAVSEADLLVQPGPWPEPFGMTGLEAGHLGVPTVAFDVGGVPDWLRDGENGRLVRSSPPSAAALAGGIADAARDPARLAAMGRRAREVALSRSPRAHAGALLAVLRSVASSRP
jgi:glycosyltransferase involved in cell wall biosynthesis